MFGDMLLTEPLEKFPVSVLCCGASGAGGRVPEAEWGPSQEGDVSQVFGGAHLGGQAPELEILSFSPCQAWCWASSLDLLPSSEET